VDDRALHVDAWRYEHALGLAIRAAGMRRHGEGPEFAEGPRLPPPHSSAAVVAGRTFAGRPHDVAGVVARAASIADAAGVPHAHGPDEIRSAVEAALADPLARPEPGDDILFTVELTGLPGAVHLDVTEGGWSTGLNVSTRLLSQAAKGLARLWTRGGIRASSAGFSAPADSWPLLRTHAGFLDVLGSDVIGENEELVIAGVPFCALPVAELDGARLTGGGAIYRRVVAEWCEVAGFDVAEQVRRLAGIEVPSPNPSSTG
jgi:hypothetical protein